MNLNLNHNFGRLKRVSNFKRDRLKRRCRRISRPRKADGGASVYNSTRLWIDISSKFFKILDQILEYFFSSIIGSAILPCSIGHRHRREYLGPTGESGGDFCNANGSRHGLYVELLSSWAKQGKLRASFRE